MDQCLKDTGIHCKIISWGNCSANVRFQMLGPTITKEQYHAHKINDTRQHSININLPNIPEAMIKMMAPISPSVGPFKYPR
jgi:hypothetical protein